MSIASILRDAGIPVIEHGRAGRAGAYAPVGVVNHHTGSAGNSLATVITGRSDLPGPLCQLFIERNANVHVITEGRANHAGSGASNVLNAVRAGTPPPVHGPDDTDGNTSFIGIEVDNDGVGEPYPAPQLDVLFRVNAALCKAHGWNQNHCIHHREWTRRKGDMSYGGDLRGEIARRLTNSQGDADMTPEESTMLKQVRDALYSALPIQGGQSIPGLNNKGIADIQSRLAVLEAHPTATTSGGTVDVAALASAVAAELAKRLAN